MLEIACFNLESALIADKAGADRIELCQNYSLGGLSPANDLILEVRKNIKIPVYVIVRPHARNFMYDEEEIKAMKQTILFSKEQGVNGFVFGCLTSENNINEVLCEELLELANPLPVTFHRAIDQTKDITLAIQTCIHLGFKRVLTSGAKENAFAGKENLHALQLHFGKDILLMPGGGIRSENIELIKKVTQCHEYHSAALTDSSEICDPLEIKKLHAIIQNTQ
jgi:copper homeostasis protein